MSATRFHPVHFHHKVVGDLWIDTGIDNAQWAYGLNVITFPTYGGEVVQILSVYIDDLTLLGTVTNYTQLEAIYSYFNQYFIAATQGNKAIPQPGVSSYNLDPMYFYYTERNWTFKIYPLAAPGFTYDLETVAPQWQLQAHVIDDSPDLSILKDGIKGTQISAITDIVSQAGSLPSGAMTINGVTDLNTLGLTGEISPNFGDPNTDPFETFDQGAQAEQQDISKYADYYNSLIPAYLSGNFQNLTGVIGSQPAFGHTQTPAKQGTATVPHPTSSTTQTQSGSTASPGGY